MYNHNKGKLVCNALNSLTKEIYIMTGNLLLNYTKCSQTCAYETRTYHIEVCKGKIKNIIIMTFQLIRKSGIISVSLKDEF